jgi:hypothetical protein
MCSSFFKMYSGPRPTLDRKTTSGPTASIASATVTAPIEKLETTASTSLHCMAPRAASCRITAAPHFAAPHFAMPSCDVLHAMVMTRFYAGAAEEAVWLLALTSPAAGSPFEFWLGTTADRWDALIDRVAAGADPVIFAAHRKLITIARASFPGYRECMERVAASWG